MKHLLTAVGFAGLIALGSAMPASAQDFGVRIGPGGAAIDVDRPRRRVIEERVVRPERRRTVCRREIQERVRPNGVVVRRPVEVCRTREF
jgi:hypothetical protein